MGPLHLFQEFIELLNFTDVLYCFIAVQLGIIFGMLPGLTATVGIAILTALTFKWDPGNAILVLISIYVGAIYGGSRTAILLNIPGTPASAATCLDGHPLSKTGKSAEALGLATTSSFLGSMIGLVALAFLTPMLANTALEFKSYEIFWLAIFGVAICGNLTASKDPLKGWISGILGILFSFVGMEKIQGYGRFTFGVSELMAGFSIIPVLVGTYALVEILSNLSDTSTPSVVTQIGRVVPRVKDIVKNWVNIVRSGLLGVFVGIIPGVGENIGSYVAYDFAKRASKTPEKFGKGSIEGLIASETANNAVVGGALVPVLALAIPGSPPAAVLLAALFLHNVRPGPLLMIEQPGYIYTFSAMFGLATLAMFILGLAIVKPLLRILRINKTILMPLVFVLCMVGTYAISARPFDILVMICFGLLGFAMRKLGFPEAPLVLGLILGPMVDENLRRGLILSGGSIAPFFGSAISIVLAIAVFLTLFGRTKLVKSIVEFIFTPITLLFNGIKKQFRKIS
ncbi:transporter [candidate division KSB3 bacterium]|uniref:Transporter n=1 Tax=candidate division KSB3 bacterium TaxID=2044937 RepID=A0A2G6KHL4_9BACT|nr:MAG: transporter [candidate division KSB3 bacterium]